MEKRRVISLIFIISAILLLISVFLPPGVTKNALMSQIEKQEGLIKRLEEENKVLAEENRLLRENPEYIEEVARKEMGLIKKNELIYRHPSQNKTH